MSVPQDFFSEALVTQRLRLSVLEGSGGGAERTRGRKVMQWAPRQVGEEGPAGGIQGDLLEAFPPAFSVSLEPWEGCYPASVLHLAAEEVRFKYPEPWGAFSMPYRQSDTQPEVTDHK